MDVILSGAKDLFDTYALGYILSPFGLVDVLKRFSHLSPVKSWSV